MPIVIVLSGPTVTQERYKAAVRLLKGGEGGMQRPGDWPVEGLLSHVAGQGPQGFRIVDVWDSEDSCRRFGEQLAPVLQQTGITDPPEVYPAQTFVSAALSHA
ncbi:hypothetical protein SAMN05660464_2062 [Geodermatophilus dictyosporus]|uniref:Antibiotic biosynthesis monooxygenase n=1 Tax=Geodermatophilus dictyosporus TaxID=1523247 RepID=A0A1I5MNI2_9ACTN|nr:hypothetical protein [Geodermatophilus dictyosporus]SFP10491.1 hypothetical protein SAMN05660464_2062 [Geodermatophilus dictyosporus]